jgi:hypothetical protein
MDVQMDKSGIERGCRRSGVHGSDYRGWRGRRPTLKGPTRPSMVKPPPACVHAEGAIPARRPAFPQGVHDVRERPHNWGISCAQTAIIPTNSAIDANAAASSTKIFNIARLPRLGT